MTEQQLMTPIEAINEFYRLKDKYQSVYYEKYVKPIIKSNKSKREKRIEYSRLPKRECINCKRNVETLFIINEDKNELVRKFKAKCGDRAEPCPLDIEINYASREQFDRLIKDGLTEIENIKIRIIKEKNNALFFSKDVVSTFEKITQQLKSETEFTGAIIETNLLRNDNPEKRDLIKETMDEFGKGCIIPFKEMVNEYMETNNELILNRAVNFYINEMIPKLKDLLSLKYDINMVEYDETTNIYKLIQIKKSLENNEFFFSENDKVVKFIRGVRKDKKKTRKEELTFKPKNKTKKIKPLTDFVLEDEDEDEELDNNEAIADVDESVADVSVAELENKYGEKVIIKPIIDENGQLR
jgi:predicted outer membrane protein